MYLNRNYKLLIVDNFSEDLMFCLQTNNKYNLLMKKRIMFKVPAMIAMGIILLTVASCSSTSPTTGNSGTAPTNTTGLIVSAVTTTAGGNYAPRNVVAIWVENNSGTFIKSLTIYAAERTGYLTKWQTASNGSTTDARTGATQSNFGTVYGTWNGTDTKGAIVADGTYKVCMELTDKNSTGNFSSFTFIKGATTSIQTPANTSSFSSVTVKWMPL